MINWQVLLCMFFRGYTETCKEICTKEKIGYKKRYGSEEEEEKRVCVSDVLEVEVKLVRVLV